MIPRIIHYTWFSSDPMPDIVKQCIASWHRFMPTWRYELWDFERVKNMDNVWLQECLAVHKWAFAADYIRTYALFHYGGIYFDTDVEVYRSFDLLLSHEAFIGREWYVHTNGSETHHYLSSHCFGAEAHHPFVERCLQYYDDRHFCLTAQPNLSDSLRFDQTLLPFIQCNIAQRLFGYDPRPSVKGKQELSYKKGQRISRLIIYPYSYFDCFQVKESSYCRHISLGSWYGKAAESPNPISIFDRIKYRVSQWFRRFMWRNGFIIYHKQ